MVLDPPDDGGSDWGALELEPEGPGVACAAFECQSMFSSAYSGQECY